MKLRKPEDSGKRPPYETSPGDGERPRPSIGGGAANERGDAAQPLRKLARLCIHNGMGAHLFSDPTQCSCGGESDFCDHLVRCPGGVFLPDDTLIIEKVDGVERMAESAHQAWLTTCQGLGIESRKAEWGEEFMVPYADLSERGKEFDRIIMRAILDALSVREAE